MTDTKKSKRKKDFTVEELYQNKNFVHPKEKNLETIFEEPKQTRDGLPILTSTRKYRRYLDFDPTNGKVQKRKKNAKKCFKKLIGKRGRTRSITKAGFNIDLILETIENSSDDSLTNISLNQSDYKSESNETMSSDAAKTNLVRNIFDIGVNEVKTAIKENEATLCCKTEEGVRDCVIVDVLSSDCVCLKTVCCCRTSQTKEVVKSVRDSDKLMVSAS